MLEELKICVSLSYNFPDRVRDVIVELLKIGEIIVNCGYNPFFTKRPLDQNWVCELKYQDKLIITGCSQTRP